MMTLAEIPGCVLQANDELENSRRSLWRVRDRLAPSFAARSEHATSHATSHADWRTATVVIVRGHGRGTRAEALLVIASGAVAPPLAPGGFRGVAAALLDCSCLSEGCGLCCYV